MAGPQAETAEFFRWKHLENPFGRSYMLLAEAEGDGGLPLVHAMAIRRGRRTVTAVRAVDTATHPDHQGRGIFRLLTTTAIEALRAEADLIFNTPNDKSLPGYLKMGWRRVADVPIRVRVRRPVRFVRHLRSYGPSASRDEGGIGRKRPDPRPGDLAATLEPRQPWPGHGA